VSGGGGGGLLFGRFLEQHLVGAGGDMRGKFFAGIGGGGVEFNSVI